MLKSKLQKLLLVLFTGLQFGANGQELPAIVQFAKQADWEKLTLLVADGSDVNSAYADGTSVLHWVSYKDNVEMARLVISGGANVNAITDIGVSPLWLAAENGSAAMTQLLLKAGADPGATLMSGESIVMTAARTGNQSVVEQLLEAGADPDGSAIRGQTALMWAAGQGHGAVVRTLLKYGANVDTRTEVQSLLMKTDKEQYSHPGFKVEVKQGGNTALMFAARSGDLISTISLVEAGSDVNATSAFGLSAVIMAVHGGNAEVVAFLARSGANLDLLDPGYAAIHAAVLLRNYPAAKVLLANGADPNVRVLRATPTRRQSLDFNFHETFVGATPLWLAARFTEPELMKILLQHGADPYYKHTVRYPAGGDGEPFSIIEEGEITVLMAAVGMGNSRLDRVSPMGRSEKQFLDRQAREALVYEAVKLVINTGVDPQLKDASGRSALDTAKSLRYGSVITALESEN